MNMRRPLLFGLVLLAVGCGREQTAQERAAGSWPGHFAIESVSDSSDPKLIEDRTTKGTLWLYIGGEKFRLEMKTRYQEFTVTGKWSAKGERITLTSSEYDFKNPTEEDRIARKLPILTGNEIREALGRPVILDLAKDRRSLTGLKSSIGPLVGRFEFERPIPR